MEPTVVKESANLAGNYVGGKWQRSQSSSALDVINPATSESLARIALAEAGDVAAAVEAAVAAFPEWRRTPPQELSSTCSGSGNCSRAIPMKSRG